MTDLVKLARDLDQLVMPVLRKHLTTAEQYPLICAIERLQGSIAAIRTEPAVQPSDRTWQALVMSAAAQSGDPKTIELAAQLCGAQPCATCGYIKTNCQCPAVQPEAPAVPSVCPRCDRVLWGHGATTTETIRPISCGRCGMSFEAAAAIDAARKAQGGK